MKIRKILSIVMCMAMLLAVAPVVAPSASAATTPTKVYLRPGVWNVDGAWFAAYFFGNGDTWVKMTDSDGDGIYSAEVPQGYPNIIFCRMDSGKTALDWSSKWNQTDDLTLQTNGNDCYSVTGWGGADGSWGPVFTVAGTISAAGWTPANGEKMTDDDGDGVYTYTYPSVAAGNYEFKVTDGSWTNAWPSSNYVLNVTGNGAIVTVSFNYANTTVSTKVEYGVSFTEGNNVTFDGAAAVTQGGNYTATLTAAEGYTLPETITVTVDGVEATHTWDASTGKLTITGVTGEVVITAVGEKIPDLAFCAASLTVSEGISINFKAEASLFGEGLYTNPTVTFVFNKGTESERAFTAGSYTVSGDKYVFQLKNIRPDWMGDTVTATLTATLNGNPVSYTMEYSVLEYCKSMLGKTENESLKTVLVDLLNYGAAAQIYTNYKTNALVTDDDVYKANASFGTSETPSLTGAPAIGTGVENPAAIWKGVSLYLRETTRIRVSFTADSVENVTVTAAAAGTTYTIDSIVDAGNGKYYVFFDALTATQMRQDVIFTVMQGDTAISNTLTCSVEAYAASAGTAGNLGNMLIALMKYGDAVSAYQG